MEHEVFGTRGFVDVVGKIRSWTYRKYWGEPERLEDAVSVATLALLEYWIPRFAKDNPQRNFNFAVSYGCHRVTEHLLAEFERMQEQVTIDSMDDESPLSDTLADPAPSAEDVLCAEALVEQVRAIVGELDYESALSRETTRQEAKRTGRPQSTVNRNRRRAQTCLRAAYMACV